MSTLTTQIFPRTLPQLVARAIAESESGDHVEIWCFEAIEARHAAEAALRASGLEARVRCALKPLVHAILEEIGPVDAGSLSVVLPAHPDATADRFRIEAYPLAALVDGAIDWSPGTAPLDYDLEWRAGGEAHRVAVFAPNRSVRDHLGDTALRPCGWLRITRQGQRLVDEAVVTEVEALFDAVMAAVAGETWGTEPYFERMAIEARIPALATPLAVGNEVIDMAEALHEDLYFSLLEFFQRYSGRAIGARDLRPGQIVPFVTTGEGDATLAVRLVPYPVEELECEDANEDIEEVTRPLSPVRVLRELELLGGDRYAARSRIGREVPATFIAGTAPGVVISGGQHPNEASGVVGALRAANRLAHAGVRVAVSPCENPDGYALHHRLRRDHPHHMHHAARYTALGDDLGHRPATHPEPGELAVRLEGFRRMGAGSRQGLHVNLHGYPAHEWIRPFTGYLPRGFSAWALPKGFFLILRYRPEVADMASPFLDRLTARLAHELPDMLALNDRQIALYRAHCSDEAFEVRNGVAIMMAPAPDGLVAFELITEFPDETVYGADFRLAHDCQTHAAVAAAHIYAEMMPGTKDASA